MGNVAWKNPLRATFERFGARLLRAAEGSGEALILTGQSARWLTAAWKKRKDIAARMVFCGYGSLGVTLLVGLFTGMVLALQAGIELARYNQEAQVGLLVSASMFREMGPVMTGIILAALVGSAYAAELGTMSVSEEIDALRVMSIDPIKYLVMPRVLALTVMCPILSLLSDMIGILGGAIVAMGPLRVDFTRYMERAEAGLDERDLWTGLLKATAFGLTIASVACTQGLSARQGAEGVGRATMRAVVISFVLILVFDYFLTWMFY
ncbi:MAG: ABC transporter permease [Planctomycetales bacterium]|nr:ABC transporter permease [Planctomycetales bacterium]